MNIPLAILLTIVNIAASLFTAAYLYGLFLVPLGVPSVPLWHIYGLILTLNFLQLGISKDITEGSNYNERAAFRLFATGVTAFIAWVLTSIFA